MAEQLYRDKIKALASELNRQLTAVESLERELASVARQEPLLKKRAERLSAASRQMKEAVKTVNSAWR